MPLLQALPHLRVDDREADAHGVDDMVVAVRRVAHARHAQHLVILDAVAAGQVAVGDDALGGQGAADVVGLDELEEALLILLVHVALPVVLEALEEGELGALLVVVGIVGVGAVADGFVGVQVHVVDAAVVRGHGGDHVVQLGAVLLLLEQLLLEGQALLHLPLLGLLPQLALAHVLVHVLEAADHAQLAVRHVQPGEFDAEIALGAVGHLPQIVDVVLGTLPQMRHDAVQRQLLPQARLVRIGHHVLDVGVLGLGVLHVVQGVAVGHGVLRLPVGVAPVEGEGLGLHVVDEPDRVVGFAQRLDDRLPHRVDRFHPLPLLGDVRDEHVVDAAVGVGLGVVAVVVHPAHRAVPADDPVFGVVHLDLVAVDLLLDGFGDRLVVVRVQHAPEGVPRQRLERRLVRAAEDVVHRVVGVQDLLRRLCPVDEETARHVLADLLDGPQILIVQLKFLSEHLRAPSPRLDGHGRLVCNNDTIIGVWWQEGFFEWGMGNGEWMWKSLRISLIKQAVNHRNSAA